MNASEVARILHIDEEEFLRIEPSVATVFHLDKDKEGHFQYSSEHLEALRQLFEEALGGAPELPELDPQMAAREAGAQELLNSDAFVKQSEEIGEPPRAIPLKSAPRGLKWAVHKGTLKEEKEEILPDGRKILSAADVLGRIQKDQDLSALKHKKVSSQNSEESLNQVLEILREQREFIETRLNAREETERLRGLRELEILKKENMELRRKIETLTHIIKNQNEDKKYLIERLNRKYSLWNLVQWRQERRAIGVKDADLS